VFEGETFDFFIDGWLLVFRLKNILDYLLFLLLLCLYLVLYERVNILRVLKRLLQGSGVRVSVDEIPGLLAFVGRVPVKAGGL